MSDQSVYTTMYTVSAYESYLVIQGQVREGRDVLGPLHQDQQLLFHGLAHIRDGGDLLGPYVAVQYGSGGGDLHKAIADVKSRRCLITGEVRSDV